MIEIEVKELSKMYGGNTVFHNINFTVQTGEKIGLIGANGCGKTTLMKILSGEETSDAGDIFKKKGIKCGYLAQIEIPVTLVIRPGEGTSETSGAEMVEAASCLVADSPSPLGLR